MFAMTSGTTAARKTIPITPRYLHDYRGGWNRWGLRTLLDHQRLSCNPILQLAGDMAEYHTEAGIPCGSLSGLTVAVQKRMNVAELVRAKDQYDSVGVYVRPNPYPPYEPHGKFASDPRNEEFWAAAEDLGVTVCFHEAALLVFPTPGLDRFGPEEYNLIHAGAHPIGQIYAMLEMMGTGVLDRYPRLRIGFLEAGCGWVPSWLHRFDEHVEEWAGGNPGARAPGF